MASEITYRFQVGDVAIITSPARDAESVTIRMRAVVKTLAGDWVCAYLVREASGVEWIAGDGELRAPLHGPDANECARERR